MIATPPELYPTEPTARDDVLPALRDLLSQHPATMRSAADTLARLLWILRYLPYRPETFEVEAALEALRIEGEVAA
jgi:hypothetical protein